MELSFNQKDNKSNAFFIFGLSFFLLLVVVRNVLSVSIPAVLFLGLYSIIAIFSNRSQIASLCVALIPFSAVFQFKYAILILSIVYLIKYTKDIQINSSLILFLVMFIWELFHGIIYPLNLSETLRNFSEFLLCVFFLNISYKNFDYKLIIRTLVWCSIGIMFILLYQVLEKVEFDFEKLFAGTNSSYRFGKLEDAEQYGGAFNPNSLGFICNLSICALLQLVYTKKSRAIDFLSIGILVFFGVLTLSRSFLLCLALVFILYIFCGKISLKLRLKRLFIMFLISSLILLFTLIFLPTVVEGFTKRFEVDDLSNGRIDLIIFYTKHLFSDFKYLFFGIGLQDPLTKLNVIYSNVAQVPHNAIIEILLLWGLVGLFLVVMFIVCIIHYSKGSSKLALIQLLPLILMLFYVQSGRFLIGGIPILVLAFSSISIKGLIPLLKNQKEK